MTLANCPEGYRQAHSPLWLLVKYREQKRLFELTEHEPRCILVGSAANVDVWLDAVAPVVFYLEREGAGLRLTSAIAEPSLRIDARRAERSTLIYGHAVVEFSGQRVELRLSSVPPELSAKGGTRGAASPSEVELLRAATVIDSTSATTAYTPVAPSSLNGQNPTVAVLDVRRVVPAIPPAQTVAIAAVRSEESSAFLPLCEATQVIDVSRNPPVSLPHESPRLVQTPHAVGRMQQVALPEPYIAAHSPQAAGCSSHDAGSASQAVESVPCDFSHQAPGAASAAYGDPLRNPPAVGAAPGQWPHDSKSDSIAPAVEHAESTGIEPAPIVVLSSSGEREIPKPAIAFAPVAVPAAPAAMAPATAKGATTAVELPIARPASSDHASPTVLQPPALSSPHDSPRRRNGSVASHRERAQSTSVAWLVELARKHPLATAGGLVGLGFVLVVFGLGMAQILGISPNSRASGGRPSGAIQTSPVVAAQQAPATTDQALPVDRKGARLNDAEASAPQPKGGPPQRGPEVPEVVGAAPDESASLAVGHLFAGRLPEAEEVYRTLATRHPEEQTYATAARILARRNSIDCRSTRPTLRACPTVKP